MGLPVDTIDSELEWWMTWHETIHFTQISLSQDGGTVCSSLGQFANSMMIDARGLGTPYLTVMSRMEKDVNEITPLCKCPSVDGAILCHRDVLLPPSSTPTDLFFLLRVGRRSQAILYGYCFRGFPE